VHDRVTHLPAVGIDRLSPQLRHDPSIQGDLRRYTTP
jgi:hypothetical protein